MRYVQTVPSPRAALLVWLLIALPPGHAAAESEPGRPTVPVATDAAIAELRATLEQQGALLEQQSRMLEAQARQIDALRQRVEAMAPATASLTLPAAAASAQAPAAAAPRSADAQDPQRLPEMPPAVVSAGDFPRSIGIPGTGSRVQDWRPGTDDAGEFVRPVGHRRPLRDIVHPGGRRAGAW